MCVLTDNTDMVVDVLDRCQAVLSFIEESLSDGRGPDEPLQLSAEACTGLCYLTQDVRQALGEAGRKG